MKMNVSRKLKSLLPAILLLAFTAPDLTAQSKDEIIHGSYFVAFGRYANSGELAYWRNNVGTKTIREMVTLHRNYIKTNQSEREQTVKRSYMDAFGWQPSAGELQHWAPQNKTYGELMSNHVNNWLNIYKDRKEHVIKQSYHKVFGRSATADEIKYWMAQPTYTYVQLVATHTTWKQQNQNKSGVTPVAPNLNSNGITTAGLSPQAISGVVSAGGANVVAPGGGNVIAAGGLNVIAPGSGN